MVVLGGANTGEAARTPSAPPLYCSGHGERVGGGHHARTGGVSGLAVFRLSATPAPGPLGPLTPSVRVVRERGEDGSSPPLSNLTFYSMGDTKVGFAWSRMRR